MWEYLGAAGTNDHKLGSIEQQELVLREFEGYKSTVKVSLPPELKGRVPPASSSLWGSKHPLTCACIPSHLCLRLHVASALCGSTLLSLLRIQSLDMASMVITIAID